MDCLIVLLIYIGEDIMESEQINRYRPCSARCFGACLLTFGLASLFIGISIGANFYGDSVYALWLGLVFLLLNIVLVIFSIFKWNSYVYIDGEKISQKQFGKTIVLYYREITDIKMSMMSVTKGTSWLIIIKQGKNKIAFEITTKVYEQFCKLCTNENIIKKLDKLLEEKGI